MTDRTNAETTKQLLTCVNKILPYKLDLYISACKKQYILVLYSLFTTLFHPSEQDTSR